MALSVQSPNLDDFARLIEGAPVEAAAQIRKMAKEDELVKGINAIEQGTTVLFAVEVPRGSKARVTEHGNVVCDLSNIGGGLFAGVKHLEDGDGFLFDYEVDGTSIRKGIPLEVYKPNPYTQIPPGGMKGELRDMGTWKSNIYQDTVRKWYVYLPPNLDPSREYPLLVAQDAQWDRQWIANGLENCAADGTIQPTVGVFIEPGQDKPGNFSNRSREYDPLSPKYSEFLLTEILPEVEKLVKLSKDPAKRAITGMSSGGICSFTACWERPDVFGVAISFIGSFANIASGDSKRDGGHNYPFLIRKTDRKPIRVFIQDGENDLNNDHGSWWLCNLQMESALKYKGYDYVWCPGKGFHSTKHARRVFDQALKWWLSEVR